MEVTIDELVDNLIKEKHLSGKDADEIAETLETASKYIEPSRLSGFVKSIREKIDAPTSEVFSQNGLNINELKNVAEIVAKVVIKEQVEYSEKRKRESFENQENYAEVNDEKNDEKKQFEERVTEYKNNLNTIYVDLLGLDSEDIPEEFREEIAREIARREKYNKELKEIVDSGKSAEEGKKILDKKYNYDKDEESELAGLAAQANYDYLEITKIAQKNNLSIEDATLEYYKQNPERMVSYDKYVQKVFKGEEKPQQEGGMLEFWKNIIGDFYKNRSDKLELNVIGMNIAIEKYVDTAIDDDNLFEKIQNKEKQYRFLKFNQKIQEKLRPKKSVEIKEKRNELLKEAREKFLLGDMTASEIFDELKDTYKEYKIDSYDIIEEIKNEAKKHIELTHVDTLKEYETNIREYSITIDAYKKIKENALKEGRTDLAETHDKKIKILEQEIENIKVTNKAIKNTIIIRREREKETEDKENKIDNEKLPKKKGLFGFLKKAIFKNKIEPKDVNEETATLNDLQREEVQEDKEQPKAISENKTNNQLRVSSINVEGEEIATETANKPENETKKPDVGDDGR